ncbi:MAG: hypothetical protein R2800_06180 [Flavipsychrobacter sp.]
MSRYTRFLLLFLSISVLCNTNAEAQFFKKLFGKKSSNTATVDTGSNKKKDITKINTPYKAQKFTYPQSVTRNSYRVDVFMRLYLDESIVENKVVYKTKLPSKIVPSLFFYEGMLIALDTLNKKGYNFDIHVHDIANPYTTPEMLIQTGELDGTDLLIGALQSSDIPEIADYAKRNEVNFISALSPSDADIVNNPYFIMIQPTLQVHCNEIKSRLYERYGKVKPLMLYRTNNDIDLEAYNYLKEGDEYGYIEQNCNSFPLKSDLEKHFIAGGKNIIVLPIINTTYAVKLLNALAEWFPTYSFDIWGMPSWNNMSSLKSPTAFPNMAVHLTNPFYFDNSTGYGKALSKKYAEQFGDETPNELVYRGYEMIHWYADLLKKYGRIFNNNINQGFTPFARYKVKPVTDKDGNIKYLQNTHLYLYRYQSSSYIVLY